MKHKSGIFSIKDKNWLIIDGEKIGYVNDISRIDKSNDHVIKYRTFRGRKFSILFAHAGYPWLWKEIDGD